eukprot:g4728.t1
MKNKRKRMNSNGDQSHKDSHRTKRTRKGASRQNVSNSNGEVPLSTPKKESKVHQTPASNGSPKRRQRSSSQKNGRKDGTNSRNRANGSSNKSLAGGGGMSTSASKKRQRKKKKPYSQMTWQEKKKLEDDEELRAKRKEMLAEKNSLPKDQNGRIKRGVNVKDFRPPAPRNTSQFIINSHDGFEVPEFDGQPLEEMGTMEEGSIGLDFENASQQEEKSPVLYPNEVRKNDEERENEEENLTKIIQQLRQQLKQQESEERRLRMELESARNRIFELEGKCKVEEIETN